MILFFDIIYLLVFIEILVDFIGGVFKRYNRLLEIELKIV